MTYLMAKSSIGLNTTRMKLESSVKGCPMAGQPEHSMAEIKSLLRDEVLFNGGLIVDR